MGQDLECFLVALARFTVGEREEVFFGEVEGVLEEVDFGRLLAELLAGLHQRVLEFELCGPVGGGFVVGADDFGLDFGVFDDGESDYLVAELAGQLLE